MPKFKFNKDILSVILPFLCPKEINACLYLDHFFHKTVSEYISYYNNNNNIEELVCPNCADWIYKNIKNIQTENHPIVEQLISNSKNVKILCETCDKLFYDDKDHTFFKYKGSRNYISFTIYTNNGEVLSILYYKDRNGQNLWEKYNIRDIHIHIHIDDNDN